MPRQARKKSESGKVLENVIGKRHRTVPCPMCPMGPMGSLYVHPLGLPEIVWVNDFDGTGKRTITKVPIWGG